MLIPRPKSKFHLRWLTGALLVLVVLPAPVVLLVPAGVAQAHPLLTVNCSTDNLQTAINGASPASTIHVSGTCTGTFTISEDLTLAGPAILNAGGGPLDEPGPGTGPVLTVDLGYTVVVKNLTIEGGVSADCQGPGGIMNEGTLTINNSTITNNLTCDGGGGVGNIGGTTTISNSTIGNNVGQDGGGVGNFGGTMTISNSTITDNTAFKHGGGVGDFGGGTLAISNSTITNNIGTNSVGSFGCYGGGGGISVLGSNVTIKGGLIADNTNCLGGGIENEGGMVTLDHSQVTMNSASTDGGGIFIGFQNSGGTVSLDHSQVTLNSADVDGGGIFNSSGTVTSDHSSVSDNSPDQCVGC